MVLFEDETREMAKEVVRCGVERVYQALDFFDASINRIVAWTVGFRSWQKALLNALLMPNEELARLQNEAKFSELMVKQEALKTMPFGAVWEEYCAREGVSADDLEWLREIEQYERDVLAKRV